MNYPGIVGVISRKTVATLKRTTQKVFLDEVLGKDGWFYVEKYNKTDNYIQFKNGSRIYFIDLENITKILGLEVGFWYVDEAKEITLEIWLTIQGRLRQKNSPRKAWLTTNPDTPLHWIYQTFFVDNVNDTEYEVINASTKQNTHLPVDYLRTLDKAYSGVHKQRYLDGSWVMFDGLVYDEFSLEHHVIDSIDLGDMQNFTFYRAIDWGFTNPAVCLFIAVDKDDNVYVIDEIYQSGLLIDDFVNLIKKKSKPYEPKPFTTFADPSRPDYIAQLSNAGLHTSGADNAIEIGIQKVKERLNLNELGKPTLFILGKCKNLIKEIQLYKWETQKDGKPIKEQPVKVNDHAVDALRYFVNSYSHNRGGWDMPTVEYRS